MKFSRISLSVLIILLSLSIGNSQKNSFTTKDNNDYKFSVSTVLWTFTNFGKEATNTQHYEIRASYYLSDKDAIGTKIATWNLFAPMGLDIWEDQLLNENSFYPGRLLEKGVGLVYQRKFWKGLYTAIEVMPLATKYSDENGEKIGNGFKLYNSYHLGYHIPLFNKGRFYLEPQLHVNHWPINTNVPEEFQVEEAKWDNVFLVEPNIYFGFKF